MVTVTWDVFLAVASGLFGTLMGWIASNPDQFPGLFRSRRQEWSGDWWCIWEDTEHPKMWNIDKGFFYHRFSVLKFKVKAPEAGHQWEATGSIDDLWYFGKWKSLRKLATARGTFMFKRPALRGDLTGYFLSPRNDNTLVSIGAIFTCDPDLVQRVTAAAPAAHAVVMEAFRERQPKR
jgi:hypothetical protein